MRLVRPASMEYDRHSVLRRSTPRQRPAGIPPRSRVLSEGPAARRSVLLGTRYSLPTGDTERRIPLPSGPWAGTRLSAVGSRLSTLSFSSLIPRPSSLSSGARRSEGQQQVDQVEDVDAAVAVDGVASRRTRASAIPGIRRVTQGSARGNARRVDSWAKGRSCQRLFP